MLAILERLSPLLGDMIAASVREAVRRERRSIYLEPGTCVSVDGRDASVIADSGTEELVATRLSPDVVADGRVMLLFAPAGQVVAFPIPD